MRSHLTGNMISLIGGAGIGAGLMYLLDPEAGARRREELARSAAQTAHGAGQALGATWQGLGDTAHHAADAFRSASESAAEHGREWADSIASSARRAGRSASEQMQRFYPSRGYEMSSSSSHHDLMTDVLLVAGALAVGAGLMMLLDPQQGRRRRALVRDKFVRGINETREFARKSGKYVADHARGYAAEAHSMMRDDQPTDDQLEARVRSELGREVHNIGALEVTARNGHVTLSGDVPENERERAISAARDVRGVRDVDAHFGPMPSGGMTSGAPGSSATSGLSGLSGA